MQADLREAIDFHQAIVAEGEKALVGYEREKALANMVLLAEIPTTYDREAHRQVNAGNLLLRGVPGVGKTFFGVILASVDEDKIPIFDRAAEDDAADFETHVAKERCLLHVAVTRARDQAIIMTSGTPSPFLEPFLDLPNGD